MEWHIQCDPAEISRYVLCPGDQNVIRIGLEAVSQLAGSDGHDGRGPK